MLFDHYTEMSNCILTSCVSRLPNAWYIVRFQEVGLVQTAELIDPIYAMQTAMEIALKNSMLASNMIVHGKSPRMFYLPQVQGSRQDQVLGKDLPREFRQVSKESYPPSWYCYSMAN